MTRIYRSSDDRIVAGVAAGIGNYAGIDPTLVRLAFIALVFAGGFGLLAYALCWLLIPPAAKGEVVRAQGQSRRGAPELVAGALILLGVLFLFREVGLWVGDDLVWPALLAAIGLALIWKRSSPERRASLAAEVRELRERRFVPAVDELLGRGAGVGLSTSRGTLVRIAAGAVLFAAGIAIFIASNDAFAAAREGFLATIVVVAGLALIFGPWGWRLMQELASERRERIRSQERAELAAHLHDSVLQTLALIQRHADEPDEMVRLARRQERELRSWLYTSASRANGASLAETLQSTCGEVEDLQGVRVEGVVVGDCELDENLEALVQAAREAMVNSARLSGDDQVSVYLEVEDDRVTLFVRDRGVGFDLEAVPEDRKGISESIVGRMERRGGTAAIRTAPGAGTEVELSIARLRAASTDGGRSSEQRP